MDSMDLNSQWCLRMWNMLSKHGTWAVPRSGLIFQKRDGKLQLISTMPYTAGMPMSESELREYQDADFEVIREEFHKIGVEVVRDETTTA